MNTEAKNTIVNELCECSRMGMVDQYETIAILDAILKVWHKILGQQQKEDLYQGVLLSMGEYKTISSKEEQVDVARYYSLFPKELLKGFKIEGGNEEILADLIALTVDKAVEKGYKESKKITISDKATYKADMENFEQEKNTSALMIEKIKQLKGEEGLKALNSYLKEIALKAIATQREYFYNCVDNIVKMHASIAIAINDSAEIDEEAGQTA